MKVFWSYINLHKSCWKLENSDIQSQFSTSKIIQILLKKIFIEEYQFKANFLLLTFFTTSIFKALYFLKWGPFWRNLQKCTQDLKFFIGLVIVLEHKWRPCKMCDSVRQKLGHTKVFGKVNYTIAMIKGSFEYKIIFGTIHILCIYVLSST